MTDLVVAEVDLEDGEIESDGEEPSEVTNEDKKEEEVQHDKAKKTEENIESHNFYYTKSGKKKKSKSNKGEQKFKEKNKKNRKRGSPNKEDFAGNIEKAIRKAMNKSQGGEEQAYEDENTEDRRKQKKRKRYDGRDGINKKRKKQENTDEMDESEMMFIRGASPVQKQSPIDMYHDDDKDSYASESSNDSRGQQQHHRTQQRHRPPPRERNKNNNKNDRRRGGGGSHPMQDPDGVCLYFMQGKCHKGDDCIYSHDAHPPRKMELCKFYLMECCAKRDKCLYMHADFPCKYYHTGIPCIYKEECKFAHGKPLTDNLKNILLKHIESAPKEILGDFPRLNREGAMKMIQATQAKLMQQYGENSDNQERNIPSLFELNIQHTETLQMNQFNNDRQNRHSPKIRQSRWQNENENQNFNINLSPVSNASAANVLNIKNLTGVLTPKQISDLTKMGIDNLDQLGQLTVLQLNSIGISLKQITEIQLNTMSIQKLGLINSNGEQPTQQYLPTTTGAMDLDLRVPPSAELSKNILSTAGFPGKDIDMRFIDRPVCLQVNESSSTNKTGNKDSLSVKDMIDIDQYTKDALKFASKDKENIDISNETVDKENPGVSNEVKDVDHRVLPFVEEISKSLSATTDEKVNMKKGGDTDIRFLQPEPLFKSAEKRHRRSTTDDEDNNLLIDEKWYSSDEEKGYKKKSPASSPQQALLSPPALAPHVIEPSSVLRKLGDLSKIDISEEVTKLLNTMKSNMHENKTESNTDASDSRKHRDPRSKKSPDKEKLETNKLPNKKPHRVSIYECIDGEPTDGRRRSDVDLRKPEFPTFGDTDLRQSASGDIDLRLGLPFKAIPNYTPASEINGSINSHPPIPYKLIQIEIPRPDYTDIRNSTAKSQALVDPRLRKVFRLSLDESNSDSEKTIKSPIHQSTAPRVDPRRKKESNESSNQDKSNSLDIQTILQHSNWFKDLSSTQKINVNQNLMPITQMLKQFHQEKIPGKKIDLSFLQSNTLICGIFNNLGITVNENGEYVYLLKPKEGLLQQSYQQVNPFGLNSNAMDSQNMNMMNMPISSMGMGGVGGMNNMNAAPMHGFNQAMSDPRGGPAPGLLGIAPNIPHNFNNFGPNNFANNMYNNEFNNFLEGEQTFQRFSNRGGGGGHRGRGNERWNRGGGGGGGGGRGHRDNRKNYNDRGNWKNERH